ncbi:MAG TPA: DUF3109 family protein [Candidatus Methylomirabilis sp.]|jgi:hypothetical protein
MSLHIVNLKEARFECTYGRGCPGICCRNGRPPVYAEEIERISARLDTFLPLLRPAARALVRRAGYVSRRRKTGLPMLRVSEGWCVFFNQGCVLHSAGAAGGDKLRYKPAACALFPLTKDENDRWYVRQRGFKGEGWDLFCLDPKASTPPAAESLREEVELAQRLDGEPVAVQRPEGPAPPPRGLAGAGA